jgi:hypothetical protein
VFLTSDLLSDDLLPLFMALEVQLDAAQPLIDRYELYYEGEQRLEQLGLAIPPELRRFVVIVNWPRIAVDVVDERLERKGFQMPGSSTADSGLWDGWMYNGMDEMGPMQTRDCLKLGRSYTVLGANEDDPQYPLMTVESPREVTVKRDPRTRKTVAALKRYNVVNGRATAATLYLPDQTLWLDASSGPWRIIDRNDHRMGAVPVVPYVNRPRVGMPIDGRPLGTSEMVDVIPVTDAAARNLTNAQVAQETHAVPQRAVSGAEAKDFVGTDGKVKPVWEAYFGAVWAMSNPNAKAMQFEASDMANFERMQDLYARQAAAQAAAPPNYFGLAADDAASADAIRSREARLDRKCERRIQTFTASDKQVNNLYLRIRDGEWNADAMRSRGLWVDPSTPTLAAQADRAMKLVASKIIPVEQARMDLGYSPEEIKAMADMDKRAAALGLQALQDTFQANPGPVVE